jgi:hypothetical protein
MGRALPNISRANDLQKRNRLAFKEFVLNVNKDTFIYQFTPSSISLDETEKLFTLNLVNKRFIIDILEVDSFKDYINVYLFGVMQPQDRYEVSITDTDIIVNFISDITRLPAEVKITDFEVKGKIAEIL